MKIRLSIILLIMGVLAMAWLGFFVFTTTLSSPTSMELYMPKDAHKNEEGNKAKESGALTIMLGKDNHFYYYEGQLKEDGSNFRTSNYAGIRKIINDKKNAVIDEHKHDVSCQKIWGKNREDQKSCLDKDFVIVIKPTDQANHKNIVEILDEMTISNVKRYAMVDPFPVELEWVKKVDSVNGR